jgi:membrane fusion protein (multidrug efflux system)
MTTTLRTRIFVGAAVAILAVGGIIILDRPESASSTQSTDDAYVQADFTVVAPQVSGVIARVNVADHQAVHGGDALLAIDDRDLRIAVDSAKAQLGSAQAAIDSLQGQAERQQSVIAQAKATLSATEAQLQLAEADRDRFSNLAKDGSGTRQAQQQAQAQWASQQAARERDAAALRSAGQQLTILHADLDKAKALHALAQAQLAAAELNLSYTQVKAPVSGVVAQRRARVGGYVRVGEPLLTLVPLDALYVEANFRETQLASVRTGQAVSLRVDSLPGVTFKGHVESLGPASGVSFSEVPPHNATGNFTKIVQRLPVRVALDPQQEALPKLRVGMSVRASIDTDH